MASAAYLPYKLYPTQRHMELIAASRSWSNQLSLGAIQNKHTVSGV